MSKEELNAINKIGSAQSVPASGKFYSFIFVVYMLCSLAATFLIYDSLIKMTAYWLQLSTYSLRPRFRLLLSENNLVGIQMEA